MPVSVCDAVSDRDWLIVCVGDTVRDRVSEALELALSLEVNDLVCEVLGVRPYVALPVTVTVADVVTVVDAVTVRVAVTELLVLGLCNCEGVPVVVSLVLPVCEGDLVDEPVCAWLVDGAWLEERVGLVDDEPVSGKVSDDVPERVPVIVELAHCVADRDAYCDRLSVVLRVCTCVPLPVVEDDSVALGDAGPDGVLVALALGALGVAL